MATDNKQLINSLIEKSTELKSLNAQLKSDKLALQNELDRQREDLKMAYRDSVEWKSKYDSLKIAKTMAASREDIDAAQARLSNLVRKINKCIALINQQQ
ncbi:MAG: hypothetical protein LBN27_09695 [Prevotellaceae bacterium]|jgi:beta-lactamase class D|nr:hypothetical protein [Prevotellaceae bacterium]